MEHTDIRRKLSAYIDEAVSPDEKAEIEAHLAGCGSCREALDDLERTVAHLKGLPEVEPPPWMTAKIMAQVRQAVDEKQPSFWRRLFLPRRLPLEAFALIFLCVTGYYLATTNAPLLQLGSSGREEIASQAPAPAPTPDQATAPAPPPTPSESHTETQIPAQTQPQAPAPLQLQTKARTPARVPAQAEAPAQVRIPASVPSSSHGPALARRVSPAKQPAPAPATVATSEGPATRGATGQDFGSRQEAKKRGYGGYASSPQAPAQLTTPQEAAPATANRDQTQEFRNVEERFKASREAESVLRGARSSAYQKEMMGKRTGSAGSQSSDSTLGASPASAKPRQAWTTQADQGEAADIVERPQQLTQSDQMAPPGQVEVVLKVQDPAGAVSAIEKAVLHSGAKIVRRVYAQGSHLLVVEVAAQRASRLIDQLTRIGKLQKPPQLQPAELDVVQLAIRW